MGCTCALVHVRLCLALRECGCMCGCVVWPSVLFSSLLFSSLLFSLVAPLTIQQKTHGHCEGERLALEPEVIGDGLEEETEGGGDAEVEPRDEPRADDRRPAETRHWGEGG